LPSRASCRARLIVSRSGTLVSLPDLEICMNRAVDFVHRTIATQRTHLHPQPPGTREYPNLCDSKVVIRAVSKTEPALSSERQRHAECRQAAFRLREAQAISA
jgi:hypothetical protein